MIPIAAITAGCATNPQQVVTAAPAAAAKAVTTAPKPAPVATGKVPADNAGNVAGTVAPGSKFSKVKLGMQFDQVNELIGTPNSLYRNETGKRWIPFYFGSDVIRLQASYKGEGCLTYTGGNQFGSSGGELIVITVEPEGCI